MVWIAVALVLALSATVLWRYLANTAGWMRVVTVDAEGKPISARWSRRKRPTRYQEEGVAHLRPYIGRLVASRGRYASLQIHSPDGTRGFFISKRERTVALHLIFQSTMKLEEARARDFFVRRNIQPTRDYLAADEVRVLAWPLEPNANEVEAVCRAVLIELCGVASDAALDLTFESSRFWE